MKLYYSPGACSLAPHIDAQEMGIPVQLDRVDTKTHKTAAGADFMAVNPKGYVPVLQLDDGQLLTEGPVISQYLADRRPESGLAPTAGTMERYRLQETLGFINSEIHKNYGPLFGKDTLPAVREEKLATLQKRYALVEKQLDERDFLFGDRFTAADAYLFTVTNWAAHVKLDLSAFPKLAKFQQRVAARPAVRAAMQAEGLLK